jgi:hypothetical protein
MILRCIGPPESRPTIQEIRDNKFFDDPDDSMRAVPGRPNVPKRNFGFLYGLDKK